MRSALVLVLALVLASYPARADHMLLDLGAGSPGGATVGLGVRGASWRAVGEVGGLALGPMGMVTGTVRAHRDLGAVGAVTLALGGQATRLGYMGGTDEVVFGSVDMIGPTLALRRDGPGRADLWLEAGPLVGRCHTGCNVRLMIVPAVTARISLRF